ncbi:hypothetical protein ACFL02_09325 [Planctomycetota bacterium]
MLLVISFVIFIAVIKLLNETNKPLLCAGIYAGIQLFFDLLFTDALLAVFIGAAINFAYYFGWFWLLDRSEGTKWFLVLGGGLIFPALLRLILLSAS